MIRTSATRSRRSAPTRSRGTTGCAATPCTSSSAWTSTGRRSRRPRPHRASSPQALVDRVAERFSRHVGATRHLVRSVHPHHRGRAQGRRPRAHRADLRAIARRFLPEDVRGVVLRRVRGVQDAKRDRRTASACCTPPGAASGSRSGTGSSASAATRTSCARTSPSIPDFLGPESRRNEILGAARARASRTSRPAALALAWGIPFPRPTGDGEPQTTYVWFDALPNYLTATGFPDPGVHQPMARAAARRSARTSRVSTA